MLKVIGFIGVLLYSSAGLSATAYIETSVKRVITTNDSEFGGCMFEPDVVYSSEVSCPAGSWISLDCAGTFDTRHAGQRRYDLVYLSSLKGQRVAVRLNDERKFGRYCVADRVRTLTSAGQAGKQVSSPAIQADTDEQM